MWHSREAMNEADLSLFAHVVGRPDAHVDLAQAALMIAEAEYPGLDIPSYINALDDVAGAERRVDELGRRLVVELVGGRLVVGLGGGLVARVARGRLGLLGARAARHERAAQRQQEPRAPSLHAH